MVGFVFSQWKTFLIYKQNTEEHWKNKCGWTNCWKMVDHHSIMLLGQKFCRKSHGDWIGWASSCWSNWSDLEAAASLDVYLWIDVPTKTSWIVNHQLKNYQLTIELTIYTCSQARLGKSLFLKRITDSFPGRIQPKICVLDSDCFQDLRCLRCCFDAKPLPTLLHLEAILGQETWKTLVNQHGNRKCTRIEDVFPIKNGIFYCHVSLQEGMWF